MSKHIITLLHSWKNLLCVIMSHVCTYKDCLCSVTRWLTWPKFYFKIFFKRHLRHHIVLYFILFSRILIKKGKGLSTANKQKIGVSGAVGVVACPATCGSPVKVPVQVHTVTVSMGKTLDLNLIAYKWMWLVLMVWCCCRRGRRRTMAATTHHQCVCGVNE